MSLRVTERSMVAHSLTSLQSGLSRLADAQNRLASGKQITRPSDSPTGTNQAMTLRSAIATRTQHATNAADATGWLNHADSTLGSMSDQLGRARDLVVQGASTGSAGTDAREALATELRQVRAELLDEANTQHLGRPLFGGTSAGGTAYDASGAFVGDQGAVTRTVAEGVTLQVNVTGPQAFGSGSSSLFSVLDDAAAALTSGDPTALASSLTALDGAGRLLTSARTTVGALTNRADAAATSLEGGILDARTALSGVEDVDYASGIMDLQLQQVVYQASLSATSKVLQPSLVDFLR